MGLGAPIFLGVLFFKVFDFCLKKIGDLGIGGRLRHPPMWVIGQN